jgi:hypothetical protein
MQSKGSLTGDNLRGAGAQSEGECSSIRCDEVSRDKAELPTQVQAIQQDIRQENIDTNRGPPNR